MTAGHRLVLLLALPLAAGCGLLAAPVSVSHSASTVAFVTPSLTPSLTPTSTPSPSSATGCYYVWATQNLPDLSALVQSGLQTVATGAMGNAYAFGEDCVAADGTRTFLAMESDFRVKLPVKDLADDLALGNLINSTMAMLDQLPSGQIAGPRPGRVEFEFVTSAGESLRLTVDIARYRAEAKGLDGVSVFRLFRSTP